MFFDWFNGVGIDGKVFVVDLGGGIYRALNTILVKSPGK